MKNVMLVKNMQISLNNNNKKIKILFTLSVITTLLSIFSVFITDLVLPIPAAMFAVILLLEKGDRKRFSIATAALITALNCVSVILFKYYLFSGVEIIMIGFAIAVCFNKNLSKSGTAFVICIIASLFILLNALSFAISYTGVFSFDAVKHFYSELYSSIKLAFTDSFKNLVASLPEGTESGMIDAGQVGNLLDSMLPLLISFIVIFSFVIAGFTLKIFSLIILRLDSERGNILGWRFCVSNVYAYFYLVLSILQIFLGGAGNLFAVSVANLFNIFCVVFAYIGFNFVLALLSMKRSVAFSFILLIIGLLLFSTFMVDILAIVGAFVTITGNKVFSKK